MRYSLLFLCLLYFSFHTAYGQEVDLKSADSLAIREIRARIPGETMGQKLESLLFWNQVEKERRFPLMHKIFPSKLVAAGTHHYPLKKGKAITPQWNDSTSLQSYMTANHIEGAIVLQNGKIRLERYGKNATRHSLWTSFSVAKSVTSMLIGTALKDGYIKSLDDALQKYIPELQGYAYGKVTIRQLITMTSGMDWNEDYADPKSDVAQMYLAPCRGDESHILTYIKPIKPLQNGKHPWHYSTGEIDLAGILVQKATHKTLAQYLSEKIWKPMGMQQNAYWLADECSGLNIGGSGLSVSLRDYARLGQLMLNRGKINGKPIFAKEWLTHATKKLYTIDDQGNGYGYLWWVFADGSYAAVGIFGQLIYINPKEKLVIAQIAAWPKASAQELSEQRWKFIKAVRRGLRN